MLRQPTASRRRRKRSGYRPGHHAQVRATEATPDDSAPSKVHRRECYLTSVHIKLVIFTLFLCSSAKCSSPDAAASRRRRKRSGHRPEHQNQVLATHNERRCGQRPRHHDQVLARHKERRWPKPVFRENFRKKLALLKRKKKLRNLGLLGGRPCQLETCAKFLAKFRLDMGCAGGCCSAAPTTRYNAVPSSPPRLRLSVRRLEPGVS